MTDVVAYSLKSDGNYRPTPHFEVREFRSKDGTDPIFISSALLEVLEKIRAYFNHPVRITSGYRSTAHNKTVGGASTSQHCYGLAADIQIDGISPQLLGAYVEELLPDSGGIGVYPPNKSRPAGWVHVDVRKTKSRWRG